AKSMIDDIVDGRLRDGIKRGPIAHLSVFAFGRIPLLVYLGHKLDDTVPTAVFQRHRISESWEWPEEPPALATFEMQIANERLAADAVLVLNVSGTIQPGEVPAELAALPRYTIGVTGTPASIDVIDSPIVLRRFEQAVRNLLAHLEAGNKSVQRLHVFPAV